LQTSHETFANVIRLHISGNNNIIISPHSAAQACTHKHIIIIIAVLPLKTYDE
jgi:hypothetical protein